MKIRRKAVGTPLAIAPPPPYVPSSYSMGPYSVGPYSRGAGAPSAGSGWVSSQLCPAVTWRATALPAFSAPQPSARSRMFLKKAA
jgi:hypothetical protein